MVTTDVPQLQEEYNTWREVLRSQREEFTRMKNELQQAAAHITSKDALKDVEHYENQFDIQLANIHDLKQSIKFLNKMPVLQPVSGNSALPEFITSGYEKLAAEYQHLRQTLHEIKNDFKQFLVNYS
ncbi:hypothetical protein [Agriterribacter sp.]|uniref:hypothetical protein n=1 Tax=Agriterribacter sp. TaxID=2821509 RepID=UPI002CB7381E|nr:hypothetical protein [Agriterribacter sp.]HTN07386.1 hypothetical protein [Agriterribacter sp.]